MSDRNALRRPIIRLVTAVMDDRIPGDPTLGQIADDLLAEIEPLIRADERAKNEQMAHAAVRAESRAVRELTAEVADAWAEGYRDGENAMQAAIDQAKADVRDRLRAKVAALVPPVPSTGYRQGWDGAVRAVLDLLLPGGGGGGGGGAGAGAGAGAGGSS